MELLQPEYGRNLAAAQDYDAFFEQEIAYRKLGLYPPFCGLCVIGFAGPKEIEVARAAARFSALLGQQAAKQPDLPLRVLGPTPGSIEKINDSYRYKLTVKCRNDRRFRDLVRNSDIAQSILHAYKRNVVGKAQRLR